MRVSVQAFFQNSIDTLQRLQSDLNSVQEQIATGRRIQRPSDDPVGAARALDLEQSVARIDQYQRNLGLVQNRLQLQEQTLTGVTDLLQRSRELTLQGANATQTNQTRGFIATELRQILDAALALANTRDSSDEYLFGGYQTTTQPFSKTATGFVYNGDQGQRLIQVSANRQLADSDPGDTIFARIRAGNGQIVTSADGANSGTGVIYANTAGPVASYDFESYRIDLVTADSYEVRDGSGALIGAGTYTAGESIVAGPLSVRIEGEPAAGDRFDIAPSPNTDIFSTLAAIADALEQGVGDGQQRAELDNALNAGLAALDQGLSSVLTARTDLGTRLAVAEAQVDANAGAQLVLQKSLSDIQDLDYAAAISALTQQTTALEAAQQSFVRIQGLSLFDYL